MSEEATTAAEVATDVTNGPIAAAMVLLAEAEVVAGAIRSQADHYARQRETEADLLVQKARRVLMAAEAKAEVILASARNSAEVEEPVTIDLDEVATELAAEQEPSSSDLDKLLEAAIGRAVNTALLADS